MSTVSNLPRGVRPLAEFARLPLRTLTAAQAGQIYSYPSPQLARLSKLGLLHRAAHGYYIVVPQDCIGTVWRPELEAVAAGIGTSIFGADNTIVMGISAARLYAALPRAMAVALIAAPRQHARVRLTDRNATIRFVARDTERLDAELVPTALGPALVTTPEQTVLDLARRPSLGHAAVDVPAAIRTLYRRCDRQRLQELASDQRMRATLARVTEIVEDKR